MIVAHQSLMASRIDGLVNTLIWYVPHLEHLMDDPFEVTIFGVVS